MTDAPIFTTEPMATRALAAEIRHDASRFLALLSERTGLEHRGVLERVTCEGIERVDVQLELEDDLGRTFTVGIEAKLDHALTREQIAAEAGAVDLLVVLVVDAASVPRWLPEEHPGIPVLTWAETLATFPDSRITVDDLAAVRLSKTIVERRLGLLRFDGRLDGWRVEAARGGSGMPSIVFESPSLPCGRTLRGQLQMTGRGRAHDAESVRFESHVGVSVPEDAANYFDPDASDAVPGWIEHLRTLQREVLDGEEQRLLVSTHAPGVSRRGLGRWKTPLAWRHLGAHAHLAKGYTDGWAIGPKLGTVGVDRLDELADATVEVFERWFAAESTR